MKITYNQPKYLSPAPAAASWLRHLVLAWLTAAAAEYLLLPAPLRSLSGLEGIAAMSMLRMAGIAGVVFVIFTVAQKWIPETVERILIFCAFAVLCFLSLLSSFTWPYLGACGLILAVAAVYMLRGWNGRGLHRGTRQREQSLAKWLTAMTALVFFLLVSAWTAARVFSFSTPSYDFGIFSQMFHSMRTTGLPITTLERDGPLSHFAVHVSPIYYLLLPFYALVPHPATLQVLQAAVLASGVIPLWKLGRHHNLSPLCRVLLCAVLLAYPAYSGGTGYDIHENAFLTPLILWLLCGIDRRSIPMTALSALLVLTVKEDAAVYVAVIALYLLLRSFLSADGKWGIMTGSLLLAGAIGWFLGVTGYLARYGDGVMTYRYSNFMYDGSDSLFTVIKAVILCPMKAVYECVDSEKLEFIALTVLPLAALPLVTRRYERYVLLIPYLLVNLMSDYRYQHDIFFQYVYGSTGCLIYLTLVNLADIRHQKQRIVAIGAALTIGITCFAVHIMPRVVRYTGYLSTYSGYYQSLRSVLDVIPEGASTAATTYYTTYLSQRETLYDIRYASTEHVLSCEYMAVGVSDSGSLKKYAQGDRSGREVFTELLIREGYVKIAEYPDKLEIYQKQ